MDRNQAIKVAKKLKTLAEKSNGPEKISATKKLKSLCKKHGLNEQEYSTELVEAKINYDTDNEASLLSNIICMILETDSFDGYFKNGVFNFRCTQYQYDLIINAFAHYRELYKDYCDAMLVAMVSKNEIINKTKPKPNFSMEPMTEQEKAEFEKIKKGMPSGPSTGSKGTDTASDAKQKSTTASQSPNKIAKKNETISKLFLVIEKNRWSPPAHSSSLFLI